MVLIPTLGRVVEYIPGEHFPGEKVPGDPLTGTIAFVHPHLEWVNLTIFDKNGVPHALQRVPFFGVGDEPPPGICNYACWPRYLREAVAFDRDIARLRRESEKRSPPAPPPAMPTSPETTS